MSELGEVKPEASRAKMSELGEVKPEASRAKMSELGEVKPEASRAKMSELGEVKPEASRAKMSELGEVKPEASRANTKGGPKVRTCASIPFTLTLLVAIAGATAPAAAHHGWSGYDSSKETTLTGTIRESGYEHPHGYIRLEAGGKVWVVVLAPPTRMENRGLPRAELRPGATATVVGYPNRTDPDELRAERITVAGKTTELR